MVAKDGLLITEWYAMLKLKESVIRKYLYTYQLEYLHIKLQYPPKLQLHKVFDGIFLCITSGASSNSRHAKLIPTLVFYF